jgi:hypothetical protein
MEPSLFFSILAAGISLGGILIGFGVIKGKVERVAKENEVQATKEELTAAIRRSDEMLAIITKRAEEDRALGEGRYKEYYALLTGHAERIKVLETTQQVLTKSLDDIKIDLKVGFKELQNELKELRKRGNNGSD